VCIPAYGAYQLVYTFSKNRLSAAYTWFWSVMAFIATSAAIIVFDTIGWSYRGRGWVYMQKYFIFAKRRIDIWMNVHQTALAPR
jgi:hypothetical protein